MTEDTSGLSTWEKKFFSTFGFLIALCLLPPLGCFVFNSLSLNFVQQNEVNWVLDHRYPGSVLQKADGEVSDMPTGQNIAIAVTVTFSSADPFDIIKTWYRAHPDGGRYGLEVNTFPQNGLEIIETTPGKTIYTVNYVSESECTALLSDCTQTLHQIR